MVDFEAPSFSFGFDFDFNEPEPQATPAPLNELTKQPNNTSNGDIPVADDDFEIETLTVVDSDDDDNNEEVRPRLKWLRRGCSAEDKGISGFGKCKSTVDLGSGSGLGSVVVDDDDIEDFSSPEDNNAKDENLSTQHLSFCNSSKLPLTGLGVLTKESGKRKQNVSDVTSAPESVITSCSKQPFPKLTVSPLRKFQLIDSDSDSDIPSINKVATKKTCDKSEPYLNRGQSVGLNQPRKLSESLDTLTRKDLWDDFRHEKSFHIPTPALDEVCVVDLGDPRLPAHLYFFHNDLRIQNLGPSREL